MGSVAYTTGPPGRTARREAAPHPPEPPGAAILDTRTHRQALRARAQERAAPGAPPRPAHPPAARVVLLVDHGPTLRTVVQLHLGNGGEHEYVEAADAAAACAILARGGIDLVTADVAGSDAGAL